MNLTRYKGIIIGVIVVIALLFLLIWDNKRGRNDNKLIRSNELTELKGTIRNKPTIEVAEQGGPWVAIRLNEFPGFKFDVGEVKYPALRAREFVNEVSSGDTVSLSILTYDFETKIKKKKQPRILEQLINYRLIE